MADYKNYSNKKDITKDSDNGSEKRRSGTASEGTGSRASQNGKKSAGDRKGKVTVRERGSNHKEIAAVVILAVCIFFVVAMFGKAGFVGNFVVDVFYGFFGGFGTVVLLCVAVSVSVSILRGTEKRVFKLKRCILLGLMFLCGSALLHTLSGAFENYMNGTRGFAEFVISLWTSAKSNIFGGGIIGGAFSSLLQSTVAKVGTYVILIPATFILAMVLFSFSLSSLIGKFESAAKTGWGKFSDIKSRFAEQKAEKKKIAAQENEDDRDDESEDGIFNANHENNDGLSIFDGGADMPYKNEDPASEEEDIIFDENTGAFKISELSKDYNKKEDAFVNAVPEDKYTEPSEPVSDEENGNGAGQYPDKSFSDELVQEKKRVAAAADVPVLSSGKYVNYAYPSEEILTVDMQFKRSPAAERAAAAAVAKKLEAVLRSFSIEAKVTHVSIGPTVTRYELLPSSGVRVNRIKNLSDDIALNLAAESIRIEAPIPGKAAIGIEVPNKEKRTVYLREIIGSAAFKNSKSKLTFCLGSDISGTPVTVDLEKMPHLMIGGTTGSGKSVCTNGLIISILYKSSPDEVRLILIDPKIVEFSKYNGIPHLLLPVVTEPKKAAAALAWAVSEMEKRYKMFASHGVRDISSYNSYAEKNGYATMPRIVIIIDELADLMMVARDSVETAINRIAQKARAAGMHLVIATQRPSVDVITGLIKSNVPSRIALKVASPIDSRIILDGAGAEKLLGRGDMLFYPVGSMKTTRIQGAFVSDEEIERLVNFIKSGAEDEEYIDEIIDSVNSATEKLDTAGSGSDSGDEEDSVFREAVRIAIEEKQISASYLQRRLKIGFNRAARIVDLMEERGIISCRDGNNPRKVLVEHYEGVC